MIDNVLDKYELLIAEQQKTLKQLQHERRELNRIINSCVTDLTTLVLSAVQMMESAQVPSKLVLEILDKYTNEMKELYK